MNKARLILLIAILLLPFLLLALGQAMYNTVFSAVSLQESRDETRDADVIIIFGAAIGAGAEPSPVLEARIMRGLELYNKGYASRFILTGGIGWAPPAEAIVMKRILNAHGVADEHVFLETQSTSTIEQVSFSVRTMQDHGWHSALLVSDPLHMHRLKESFAASGLQVYASPSRTIKMSQSLRYMYTQMEVLKLLAFRILAPAPDAATDASAP